MTCNYLLLFFGISACSFAGTVAREAIVGGSTIPNTLFQFQVSVQIHRHRHVCGGGIIDDRFILSAAHCVLNHSRHLRSTRISILAGTESLLNLRTSFHSWWSSSADQAAVRRQVDKVFFPSDYHPNVEFKHGDISVLRLRDSLQLEQHAKLRKLELPKHYEVPRTATIAGFGWNQYQLSRNKETGRSDGILRFAAPVVLSNVECERTYPHIQVDIHLCTDTQSDNPSRYGVCTGDSGGPLVVHEANGEIVIGILSRIPPHCNERESPAVYTRVTHYLSMIFNVMERDYDPQMISLDV